MPLSEFEGLAIRTLRGNRRGEVRFDDRGNPIPYREPTPEEAQDRLRTLALQEQARAQATQAEAQRAGAMAELWHENTARELGGLSPYEFPAGAGPLLATGTAGGTNLIGPAPGFSGGRPAAVPKAVQDEIFQTEFDRIRNNVGTADLLMDYEQKGYLDQPGSAALLQFLRSQRAGELQGLARGDDLFGFWDKVFLSPREMAMRRSAVDQGVSGALAAGGGLPEPQRNLFGGETTTSRSVRLQLLLRRLYPDLFTQAR